MFETTNQSGVLRFGAQFFLSEGPQKYGAQTSELPALLMVQPGIACLCIWTKQLYVHMYVYTLCMYLYIYICVYIYIYMPLQRNADPKTVAKCQIVALHGEQNKHTSHQTSIHWMDYWKTPISYVLFLMFHYIPFNARYITINQVTEPLLTTNHHSEQQKSINQQRSPRVQNSKKSIYILNNPLGKP